MTVPETGERVHLPAVPTRPGPRSRLRRVVADALADPLERACYALVAVSLLVWTWAASRSYFRQDDFVYFYRATTSPLDLDHLFSGYQGHLMPGQFLLVEGVVRVAPLSWAAAVAVVLAFRLVASVAAVRLLVELFGRRPGVLAPLAVFLFCPLLVLPFLWWAAALQVVTLQAATVLAALAHVRHLRTGRPRYAVAGLAAVAAGLLCWEKALLIPLVLAGVEVVARRAGMPAAPARRRRWWLAYAALVVGWALLYLWRTDPAGRQAAPATPGRVAGLVRETVLDGFLPGLLGGPWSDGYLAGLAPEPARAVVVAALVVTAGVVAATCLVRPRAAVPAWLFLALYLAVDVGLLAAVRLDFLGPTLGRDPRYTADAVLVAALVLGFALLPVAGAAPAPPAAAGSPAGRGARLRGRLVGRRPAAPVSVSLVLLPAYLTSCLLTTALAAQHMERISARAYVATAQAQLRQHPGTVVWDGPVPENVIAGIFEQDAVPSRVLALVPARPRYNEPTGDLRMFDGLGLLRPVDILPAARGVRSRTPACAYGVQAGRERAIPLDRVTGAGSQVIRIGYYAARAVPGSVTADLKPARVTFQSGVHHLYVVVEGPVARLSVGLDAAEPGTGICVTDVVVGQPWPRPGT